MMGRQVNIAIVGTGFLAAPHARAYAGTTGYEPPEDGGPEDSRMTR